MTVPVEYSCCYRDCKKPPPLGVDGLPLCKWEPYGAVCNWRVLKLLVECGKPAQEMKLEKKYKAGDQLFVKSTEEPITVLAVRKLSPGDKRFPVEYEGSGLVVIGRRPIIADGGVQNYIFYDFLEEELETDTEQAARKLQNLKTRRELFHAFHENEEMEDVPEGPLGPVFIKN